MPDDTLIVTILRPPVERLVSLYHYWRNLPDSTAAAVLEAKRLSLDEWAASPETDVAKSNQMTQLLASGVVDLDKAIVNLDKCMVGFQWDYEAFLRRLSMRLNVALDMHHEKVQTIEKPRVSYQTMHALIERNTCDLALYEYALAKWGQA